MVNHPSLPTQKIDTKNIVECEGGGFYAPSEKKGNWWNIVQFERTQGGSTLELATHIWQGNTTRTWLSYKAVIYQFSLLIKIVPQIKQDS